MTTPVLTGDLGLDLLLGGGWRLVERLRGQRSATVVLRGGPGAGKTLLALQVAFELARALDGDVAVGCVEILPSEYEAQVRAARPDLGERVAVLPGTASGRTTPRVFCGLLTELNPDAPDLIASLEALGRDIVAAGGHPVVFVVDSLIEGYGVGSSAPRASADAAMKFAAQGGYGLVLCEEAVNEIASPWVFAADTVLELGVASQERGRWIEVRKHRFAPSVSGRHEIELRTAAVPAVYPAPHAWVSETARDTLSQHGWKTRTDPSQCVLRWNPDLTPNAVGELLSGAFAVVTSDSSGLARTVASSLTPPARGARAAVRPPPGASPAGAGSPRGDAPRGLPHAP